MDGSNVSTTGEPSAADIRPRGTLVIIAIFAALFTLSWLGAYFILFLQRGTPQP